MKSLIYMIPFVLVSCRSGAGPGSTQQSAREVPTLGDMLASPQAAALYRNLHGIAPDHVLLGHQDALAYGFGWSGDPFRTDIHDVSGKHPAVFGWDLGHIGDETNIDGVPFENMDIWAKAAYDQGGINTYSWHMRNYASGGSSWDTSPCVNEILPGGSAHEIYLDKLEQAAAFFGGLEDGEGNPIPVVFRPFHETEYQHLDPQNRLDPVVAERSTRPPLCPLPGSPVRTRLCPVRERSPDPHPLRITESLQNHNP